MKNLFLFVSLLIAGASYTPPVNNASEDISERKGLHE